MKEYLYCVVVLAALIFNGIQDYKTRNIYEICNITALLVGTAISHYPVLCMISVVGFLVIGECDKFPMGMGDVEAILLIFTACGTGLGIVAIITLLISVVWSIKTKNQTIPLVSFLAIGYFAWFILIIISDVIA